MYILVILETLKFLQFLRANIFQNQNSEPFTQLNQLQYFWNSRARKLDFTKNAKFRFSLKLKQCGYVYGSSGFGEGAVVDVVV